MSDARDVDPLDMARMYARKLEEEEILPWSVQWARMVTAYATLSIAERLDRLPEPPEPPKPRYCRHGKLEGTCTICTQYGWTAREPGGER